MHFLSSPSYSVPNSLFAPGFWRTVTISSHTSATSYRHFFIWLWSQETLNCNLDFWRSRTDKSKYGNEVVWKTWILFSWRFLERIKAFMFCSVLENFQTTFRKRASILEKPEKTINYFQFNCISSLFCGKTFDGLHIIRIQISRLVISKKFFHFLKLFDWTRCYDTTSTDSSFHNPF